MREILFRGQTRRYGEKVRVGDGAKMPSHWVYGGVLQSANCYSIIYGGENVKDTNAGFDKYVVYTDTLGQFTGLTDKNGTKVFEGDIIAFTCNDGTKHFSVVKYGAFNCSCCDGVYGWYLDGECGDIRDLAPDGGMLRYISVEGNIHDNPELLEVSDGN